MATDVHRARRVALRLLNILGWLLFLAGFLLIVFWGTGGLGMLATGLALFCLYLWKAARRRLDLKRADRRFLRRWIGTGAVHRSLLTIDHGHDGTLVP